MQLSRRRPGERTRPDCSRHSDATARIHQKNSRMVGVIEHKSTLFFVSVFIQYMTPVSGLVLLVVLTESYPAVIGSAGAACSNYSNMVCACMCVYGCI